MSPNGIGREAFWANSLAGKSGVGTISQFDASGHQVRIAGEVTGFDESLWVDAKERPHVGRVTPLARAAAAEAMADAGIDQHGMNRAQLREIGVILGSGGGSQAFTEEQYRLFHTGQFKQCSV